MTNNDELAMKMKAAANQRIDADSWDSIDGRIERIGRYKDTAETLSPANILDLLAERDADKKRIADMQQQLARYSMSPGEADQRRCESRAVRDALGFGKDADNVAPLDLREKIEAFRLRIAELEARTVSVKLPLRHKGSLKFPEGKEKAFLYVPHDFYDADDLEAALTEAGIKLEVGE